MSAAHEKFGKLVLAILEENDEWDSDVLDAIDAAAIACHLSETDEAGFFKIIPTAGAEGPFDLDEVTV